MDPIRGVPDLPRRGREDRPGGRQDHRLDRQGRRSEREFRAVITEQHPDERVAWTVKDGETDHAGVVTFHKLSDSETRVTAQIDWEPSGILEKLGSAVGVGGHAVKKDLQNFKERVENAPTEPGWRGEVQA